MRLSYSARAQRDIENCLLWSALRFGRPAALRYRALIAKAIKEIVDDPLLTGSTDVRGLQSGIRLYHLRHSRRRAVVDGLIVKRPRHFIAYRVSDAGRIQVLRVLHDSMSLDENLNF